MTATRSSCTHRRWSITLLLLIWASLSWYVFSRLNRGWVPHDEGAFGQSAERVLLGEVPHRDFDELYTGGLTYLHSLAMRMFGTSLISLRFMLFGFTVVWIPALWWIARRFAPQTISTLVTITAVLWTIPNYPAAVPSWYILILSTFLIAALYRFAETNHDFWLLIAGVVGGLSVLVKVTGSLAVLAGAFWLLSRESTKPVGSRRFARILAVILASLTVLAVTWVVGTGVVSTSTILNLVIPVIAISVALILRTFRCSSGVPARELVLFGIGFSLPVASFVGAYLKIGALDDLIRGTVQSPFRRVTVATFEGPEVTGLPLAIGLAVGAVLVAKAGDRVRSWATLGGALLGGASLMFMQNPLPYWSLWNSVRWLPAVLAVMAVIRISMDRTMLADGYLVIAVMALLGLSQFPFSAPIYFLYVVTFGFLVVVALAASSQRPAWRPLLAAFVVLAAFGILWLNTGFLYALGSRYERYQAVLELDTSRAGILIPGADASYNDLINFVVSRADGEFILAGPDSPEVYFLTAKRNPTRVLFEALSDEATPTGEMTLRLLTNHGINIIVVNTTPGFSDEMSSDVLDLLSVAYPNTQWIGKFLVLWRDSPALSTS